MKAQLWASLKFQIWIVQKMEFWLNRLVQYYYMMFPTRKSQELIGLLRVKKLFEMHSLKSKRLQTQKPMAFLLTDSPTPSPKLIPPFFLLGPRFMNNVVSKIDRQQRSLEQSLIPPREGGQRPSKEGIR